MIISLIGKTRVGKDEVGKIIRYLVAVDEGYEGTLSSFNGYKLDSVQKIRVKKFAGKLKRLVAVMLNVPVSKLENEEFKNTELGEQWWFYKLPKDGKYEICSYNEGKSIYLNKYLVKPTPRYLLQYIGTDLFRNLLHPDVHVNMLMEEYQGWQDWVITDTRFKNEVNAVKDKGFDIKIIRPIRLRFPNEWQDFIANHMGSQAEEVFIEWLRENNRKLYDKITHSSETELDNYIAKYTIVNNGQLLHLLKKVQEILQKENIIK